MLAAAILYEDALSNYIEMLSRGETPKLGSCFICSLIKDLEHAYTSDFAACMDTDRSIVDRYARSKAILCLKHFEMIYSLMNNEDTRSLLFATQLAKLRSLHRLIKSFIEKSSYDSNERIVLEEAEAWIKTIEVLKGSNLSINVVFTTLENDRKHISLTKLLARLRKGRGNQRS